MRPRSTRVRAAESWVAGSVVKPGRKKARQVCRPQGSQSYRVSRRSPLAGEAIAGKSGDGGPWLRTKDYRPAARLAFLSHDLAPTLYSPIHAQIAKRPMHAIGRTAEMIASNLSRCLSFHK